MLSESNDLRTIKKVKIYNVENIASTLASPIFKYWSLSDTDTERRAQMVSFPDGVVDDFHFLGLCKSWFQSFIMNHALII